MSAFLAKNRVFCPKKYLYSKQKCESCVRYFSVSVRQKVTVTENITDSFTDSVSGIRSPVYSELAKNLEINNGVTIFRHDVIVIFLTLFRFSCQV